MKRQPKFLLVSMVLATLLVAACAQSTPPPAPTKAPAAPTAAPAPAKATAVPAAAKPTAAPAAPTAAPTAPAKTVAYPEKGRAVSVIVPFNAGGSTDIGGRLVAAQLEKEFGSPFQVVNKPGAGSQVGLTELALAKPDGYTLLIIAIPTGVTVYLDPERKAAFTRKNLQAVALHLTDPIVVAVPTDSPYKSMKDFVDAAKAKPEGVKISTTGILGAPHLGILQLEKIAGVKFAVVHFDGGSAALTAMMGGHTDAQFGTGAEPMAQVKAGKARVIGVMDRQESKFYPGVKTLEAQGYPVFMASSHGTIAPGGTPKEIVDKLSASIGKAAASEEFVKRMSDMGLEPRYMDAAKFDAYWTEMENQVKPLMELSKEKK